MASWSVLVAGSVPPEGSEEWSYLAIPGDPAHIAYAIRLVVPTTTPESWNTGGFFGLFQFVENRLLAGRTYPIPLVGRGESQLLRYIGLGDIDLVPQGLTSFGVGYYVHKWIAATSLEIWVLA